MRIDDTTSEGSRASLASISAEVGFSHPTKPPDECTNQGQSQAREMDSSEGMTRGFSLL